MATDLLKEQYNNLQEENDQYEKIISQQKDGVASLDKEITVLESKIQEKLTPPGGILKHQGKCRRYMKSIRILENVLNQDTIKFDELMGSNMEYRKDIADLLQQKGFLCKIEEKFNRQLATQKNITEKLGERVVLAFNHRSKAETQMLKVKECIEVEIAQFLERGRELKRLITQDAKLLTFMETKRQEICPLEEDEDSVKRKKQQQYQNGVKKLEIHMQAHRTLVEVTGERDLRKIGLMTTQDEQENMAYFRYINELHNRRNMLKNQTEQLKSDILSLEEKNRVHDEDSHLKDLESELEKYSCLSESLEQQCAVVERTLDQLTTAISGLFEEIMQEAVVINFDNIGHFIGILEESIGNLLIQANNVDDEQMASQNMLLANFDLVFAAEGEAVVETARNKSPSCWLKLS
ncbi:coiled-coil domain-containing protein 63-like [Cebidichthys violaceus]|uniref:coiled-coil domain-containing protein 63-like n=1 Tax=Cebidichthys violaceus TaxID=271503 RepID=UPI0035CACE81